MHALLNLPAFETLSHIVCRWKIGNLTILKLWSWKCFHSCSLSPVLYSVHCTYACVQYGFSKHRPSGPMLSISRFVRLSVRPCVCVFTFEVPFKRLFAPTFRSRMSNIFTDLESLGNNNGKKWSQIWTFLFENCQKLRHKKKFFFSTFFTFFYLLRFSVFFNGLFAPTSRSRISNILVIRNPWGKVMERSGLR